MEFARRQGYQPRRTRKKIILCFDGTGNKFQGTSADSNILKIYRMLDRGNGDCHYYQPGIGTYVNTRSLSHTSVPARLYSWYQKAKDSAVGTSFDEHVMGAYKFLMQTYSFEDDLYFFGFSRGAYVARFLAEMLDHVGLLSAGNEEMARFAWKAFAQWQERQEGTEEEKKKKDQMLDYLRNFRDTFSRPVRRIRFLGLFDTVNSVPRFENAWMQRSKFPYTARSSAKVIRHAVSIDERRAKFRQDLISETKMSKEDHRHRHRYRGKGTTANGKPTEKTKENNLPSKPKADRFRRPSQARSRGRSPDAHNVRLSRQDNQGRLMPGTSSPAPATSRERSRYMSMSPPLSHISVSEQDARSIHSTTSQGSVLPPLIDPDEDEDEDEAADQDIEEVWFPGCHADLGGGWPLEGDSLPLSHGPLVWMVREAKKAGLEFDQEKMHQLHCCEETSYLSDTGPNADGPAVPDVQITRPTDLFRSPHSEQASPGWAPGLQPETHKPSAFHHHLHTAATQGILHDCLEFNNGLGKASVLSWKMMEYMPFRRMDLKPDGSWQAISFPLPMGEVRDIPESAWIHNSAIMRMKANANYRPGNLIIGGGGRGVRKAPEEMGIGEWEVVKESGDPIGEVFTRKGPSLNAEMKETQSSTAT